jgi:poly(3-hydroxybutyrate) depolymerase
VLYDIHEYNRALLGPSVYLAKAGAWMFSDPTSWLARLPGAARWAAGYELYYRLGKTYERPAWDIHEVTAHGETVAVIPHLVANNPFCRVLRFARASGRPEVDVRLAADPKVLVVAPLSGHHATLLRDTVRSLLADHDVYVTDWEDARLVSLENGPFTLDDYVDFVRRTIHRLGGDRLHVIAVCQPTVPVLAAAALIAGAGEPQPRSLVLMGGPVDPRRSPTSVNNFAGKHSVQWFERTLIDRVPAVYPGRGRRVYPGFLQHAGFMAMNPVRHIGSHWSFYRHLVEGDLADADEHRRFYDEYNAVMDLPGEYYLDCIRVVFQQHLLPRGLWDVRGARVDPTAIRDSALMTIEGERDDISGPGQTRAAHDLCTGIPSDWQRHLTVEGAGHYGIFSGRRWRQSIYPQVRDFIAAADARRAPPRLAAKRGAKTRT